MKSHWQLNNQLKSNRWVVKGTKRGPYKKSKPFWIWVSELLKDSQPIMNQLLNKTIAEQEPVDEFFTVNEPKHTDKKLFNLTGHDVCFFDWRTIKHSWCVRIMETNYVDEICDWINIYKTVYNKTIMPRPAPDKLYIVSIITCLAYPDREDLLIPYKVNTQKDACLWLIRNPYFISNQCSQWKHN